MARFNLIKEIKILGLLNLIEQEVSDDEIKQMADWVYKNKKDPEMNKQNPMLSWASDPSQVEGGLKKKLADPEKRQQTVDYLRKRMGTNKPAEPAKQPELPKQTAPDKATSPAPATPNQTGVVTPSPAPSTQSKPTETKPEPKTQEPEQKSPTASSEPAKKSWSQVRASMGYSARDSLTDNPNLLAAYNKYKGG